jgi:hypothetical protein
VGNPGRLGLNNPPPAGGGIRESIFAVGRLRLNNPPTSAGGIQDQRNSKDLGNAKVESFPNHQPPTGGEYDKQIHH